MVYPHSVGASGDHDRITDRAIRWVDIVSISGNVRIFIRLGLFHFGILANFQICGNVLDYHCNCGDRAINELDIKVHSGQIRLYAKRSKKC